LATKDLQPQKLTVFQPRYIGPFDITKTYGENAVKLNIEFTEKISKVYIVGCIKQYHKPHAWME
jgi:hypothetical protein